MKKKSAALRSLRARHLCIGCGACQGICPSQCVRIARAGGGYKPHIDMSRCVDCGLCLAVCPVQKVDYRDLHSDGDLRDRTLGDISEAYVAWAKESGFRKNGASGGFVTAVLLAMLDNNLVEGVSVVNSVSPNDNQATMRITSSRDDILQAAGSFYASVNISNVIRFITKNRHARLGIVALPCQLYSFLRALACMGIPRDNICAIGLVCSKSLTYRVFDYYRALYARTKLEKVQFRDKSVSGAPGDVRLIDKHGNTALSPCEERRAIARFYINRRCLYCCEKYNVLADMSVGDCFLDGHRSAEGESMVMVRSCSGQAMLKRAEGQVVLNSIGLEKLSSYRNSKRLAMIAGTAIGLYPRGTAPRPSLGDIKRIVSSEWLLGMGNLVPPKVIRFIVRKAVATHPATHGQPDG